MTLLLGAVLLVVAVVLLSVALTPSSTQTGVARSLALLQATSAAPEQLVAEARPSFSERVLVPLRARALALGRRLGGSDAAARVRHKLDLAGNPAGLTVDGVLAGTVLCAGGGLALGAVLALLLGLSLPVSVVLAAVCTVVGFFAPRLYLYQKAYDRAERIRRALPDAIDLLTISVEAGLGFDAAVQQVANNTDGPLADELARVLREMQLGLGRGAALRGLADRTNVVELRTFVGAMVQADTLGIPIAQVLRVQSQEIRVKRRQSAEEQAQKVPVKITIPLIFCILPCLFVVVMGPAALSIMDSF